MKPTKTKIKQIKPGYYLSKGEVVKVLADRTTIEDGELSLVEVQQFDSRLGTQAGLHAMTYPLVGVNELTKASRKQVAEYKASVAEHYQDALAQLKRLSRQYRTYIAEHQ